MSQSDKAAYFNALKKSGVKFEKHYREYSTAELAEAYTKLMESAPQAGEEPADGTLPPPPPVVEEEIYLPPPHPPEQQDAAPVAPPAPQLPVSGPNEFELPGQRQNSKAEDEPIRIDEQGRVWYQEEVLKPAFPKPRGRRVLKYMESGSRVETVKNGDYVESFEVAGDEVLRSAEIKITLPSFQVGVYKDPRFPFKIHTYSGNQGFDLFEVQDYYGGSEMVPNEVKRVYVENVLCYDIRSTVRAIQTEYRQLQLARKVD
jgi:hypothetical protein